MRDASRSWQRVRVGVVKVVTAERGGRRSGGRSIVQPVLKRDLHARQQEAQAKAQLLNDKAASRAILHASSSRSAPRLQLSARAPTITLVRQLGTPPYAQRPFPHIHSLSRDVLRLQSILPATLTRKRARQQGSKHTRKPRRSLRAHAPSLSSPSAPSSPLWNRRACSFRSGPFVRRAARRGARPLQLTRAQRPAYAQQGAALPLRLVPRREAAAARQTT